mgnify:CR=1 FL=1|tara:strand:+ start:1808 stop:2314 length:507 start_codon:yes stop_codon:yes gene_type:complete
MNIPKKIKQSHDSALRIKNLKSEVTYLIERKNSKLACFFEECSLYEEDKNLIAIIDNGNEFVKRCLQTEKHIILDAITDMTNRYNDINFFIDEEDPEVYHLRCSTNGCINLPKQIMGKMNWKVGDKISIWEHSIHDSFELGRELEGLDLMKKEDRDILIAHEDMKIKN